MNRYVGLAIRTECCANVLSRFVCTVQTIRHCILSDDDKHPNSTLDYSVGVGDDIDFRAVSELLVYILSTVFVLQQ